MRGVYTVTDTFASFTTGDIGELICPANSILELLEVHVEMQDPKSREDLDVSITQMSVSATGGGTLVTPYPAEDGDQAFGGSYRRANTSLTGGTPGNTNYRRGFPVETGWHYTPTPEQRKRSPTGWRFTMNTSVTSGLLIVSIDFVEMG
jgi:hypothetical protein